MTDQATFDISVTSGIVVLDVRGEIDIRNAKDLRNAMRDAAAKGKSMVVVSLGRAGYFDSHTLEVLVDFSRKMQVNRRGISIVAPAGGAARRLLDVSGISSVIDVYDSTDAALSAAIRPS
jgi:anti-anti-sigma factor